MTGVSAAGYTGFFQSMQFNSSWMIYPAGQASRLTQVKTFLTDVAPMMG